MSPEQALGARHVSHAFIDLRQGKADIIGILALWEFGEEIGESFDGIIETLFSKGGVTEIIIDFFFQGEIIPTFTMIR